MGKEIEIQTKGEMEIVRNRKTKLDLEEKQKELEEMIRKLQKQIKAVKK